MSIATAAPPAPPAPAQTASAARRPTLLARATSTTPRTLRLLLVLTALAAVLFGVFAQQAASLQARAAQEAREQAAQLIGVQDVRNLLVDANAIAANTFLVGGLEPAEQRQTYVDNLAGASSRIARLAATQPDDAETLAKVATKLTTYSGLIEQARANNRQGFPVGSAYLDQASAQLTDAEKGILTDLNGLVTRGADRVAAAYDTVRFSVLLLIGSLAMLLLLVAAQVWLARRTHRYLNRPLATATGLLLLVGIGGTILLGSIGGRAAAVRADSYQATLVVSQALTAASDAKSLESFTLIKRGSGAALEAEFQAAAKDAGDRLQAGVDDGIVDGALLTELNAWLDLHAAIRDQDDGGNWDEAVKLATATGDGTANGAFTAFANDARTAIVDDTNATRTELDDGSATASIASWILLAAGLVGALLAWRGVAQRLEEYR
ncbi:MULTISPECIES: hypothetical protein [unclassified Rathayibacter]|uniref:hypothetical protein n=1 Tax=unclassified Rathayibacter TaxID=2609250 RepID=UPI000F4CB207|nr:MULTISPECIES: hypothetical protein [unclassified Rathayibacter]MCJ1702236.1 hypothetical protein [Rathayibacter sp. VKM Ac-2926]ROP57104.1 hypothetical protein EDF45_0629 [Rathayibacter sp. PhB186]ROS55489.1 hypothetical protein EDF44_0629 [Rathayibacter sp. PhB185]TCL85415.1 hypothetical protein EDF49_10182 [Rathayibacter sp. PhB192]TCM31236.1 hypothetical protein EDF43_10182 [Rathayibacter sp. PhB179]